MPRGPEYGYARAILTALGASGCQNISGSPAAQELISCDAIMGNVWGRGAVFPYARACESAASEANEGR